MTSIEIRNLELEDNDIKAIIDELEGYNNKVRNTNNSMVSEMLRNSG